MAWDHGGHTVSCKWYGIASGLSGKLSLLRYLNRLSLPLILHTLTSHTIWSGIGMGSCSQIQYHTMVWDQTPISHTTPCLSGH